MNNGCFTTTAPRNHCAQKVREPFLLSCSLYTGTWSGSEGFKESLVMGVPEVVIFYMEVPGAACEVVSCCQQVSSIVVVENSCMYHHSDLLQYAKLLHVSSLRSLAVCKAAWQVPRLNCRWAGQHRGPVTENYIQ
jgi:hypothetical protein